MARNTKAATGIPKLPKRYSGRRRRRRATMTMTTDEEDRRRKKREEGEKGESGAKEMEDERANEAAAFRLVSPMYNAKFGL